MDKLPSLTLKRVLKKHKNNPQDKKLHEQITKGSILRKDLKNILKKAI